MLLTHRLPFHVAKRVLLKQRHRTVDVLTSVQRQWTPLLLCWQRCYSADAPASGDSLPRDAHVVIAGGGVVGCSVAYHLAKAGWKDIVLLEQGRSVTCADDCKCSVLVQSPEGNTSVRKQEIPSYLLLMSTPETAKKCNYCETYLLQIFYRDLLVNQKHHVLVLSEMKLPGEFKLEIECEYVTYAYILIRLTFARWQYHLVPNILYCMHTLLIYCQLLHNLWNRWASMLVALPLACPAWTWTLLLWWP